MKTFSFQSLLIFSLSFFLLPFGRAQWHINAYGTGQTTGHIATLVIVNTGDQPQALAPQIVYIPADGNTQSYVGRIPRSQLVMPGDTTHVPVSGWCTDVHNPPVGRGEIMQPSSWVPVAPLHADPAESEPWARLAGVSPGFVEPEYIPNVREVPFTTDSVQRFELGKLMLRISSIDAPPRDDAEPIFSEPIFFPNSLYPSWPGTSKPVPFRIEPDIDPIAFAPLVVEMVLRVMEAVPKVQSLYHTPFSADPQRERKTMTQQTIWIYMGLLTGESYEKDDFAENVFRQFEEITGQRIALLPEEKKEELQQGVEAFWNAFEATGVEAKVLTRTTADKPDNNQKSGCIQWPVDPLIDDRAGFDLFGEFYRRGQLSFDLNDLRFGYREKIRTARLMLRSLETVLDEEFSSLACSLGETAHTARPQHFPEFPWEDFFLEVDFCDTANAGKNRLADYLSPDADLRAVENWYQALGHSLDNCGLNDPYSGTYMSWFQEAIDQAMQRISEAYERFQEDMETSMELRFNRSRAEARLWQSVIFGVTTIASAGIAAGFGGTAAAALASVFSSTTGFIYEQSLTAMGADPKIAQATGALISLGLGAASSVGSVAAQQLLEKTTISTSSLTALSEGLSALAQQRIKNFSLSLAVMDENAWNEMKEKLAEDYDQSALSQFEMYRNNLTAEVNAAIADLCQVRNSLRQLLPGMEEALQKSSTYLHPSFWRKLWIQAIDTSLGCSCCRYSDGRGGPPDCHVTVPPFGFTPDEE